MNLQDVSDATRAKNAAEDKRIYGCPCGKTYLSYPALFTHIKQKHRGKAPGKLIKPKTQKARGRPKIDLDLKEQLKDEQVNFEEQIERVLKDVKIQTTEPFSKQSGTHSCQHMATGFLFTFRYLNQNQRKSVVVSQRGIDYWKQEKPAQLIDLANYICTSSKGTSQLGYSTLLSLTYILFQWMYKNKWTDHKLFKRKP